MFYNVAVSEAKMEKGLVYYLVGLTASMCATRVWSRTLSVCPTATTHAHLCFATFNFSASDSQLLSFSMTFFSFLVVLFLMRSLFLCMPFMDSKTLLKTMFSILMFRIFVV